MAETESKSPETSVAINEETLAALFGPEDAAPAVSPDARAEPVSASRPQLPTPLPADTVESTLASLAALQQEPAPAPPQPSVSAPKPVATRPTAENAGANALALLAAIKENRAGLLRSEASARPAPQPAQPPPSLAPQVRPPQARVESVSPPVAAPAPVPASVKPAAPPIPEKIAAPLPHKPQPPAPALAGRASSAAPSKITVTPPRAPVAQFPEPVALAPAPAPFPLAAIIDKLPGGRRTLLIIGAVIAVGGISTGLVVRSHRNTRPKVVATGIPAPAPAATFPLQLQVEPAAGGQINVHWNPQSSLVAQAREGRLVITETNQKPKTVSLPLDQLKFGHLTYASQSERIEFRLEVVDPSGAVAEESVLALASSQAAKAAGAAPQQAPAAAVAAVVAAKTEPAPTPKAEETPQPNRPAPRAFTPPSAQRPAERAIVEAPPALGNVPLAVPALGGQLPAAAAPPPPALVKETAAAQPTQIASGLQASKLVTRITPPYPPLAKSAHVQGTVHMQATISKDGSVRNVEVLSGPPLLRPAAADAVKRWVYRPTLLNGQAVEVVTQIDVQFTLGQ